jgi:hypothetical protein
MSESRFPVSKGGPAIEMSQDVWFGRRSPAIWRHAMRCRGACMDSIEVLSWQMASIRKQRV